MRMRNRVAIIACALLATPLPAVHAQGYPARVVRIIVPTSAGGGGDVIARLIAKSLGERWGRQVVVDNRTGAGTMLGSELVARAAPDGYTLLMTPSTLAINPAAYKKVPYDALRDFAPITQAAVVPNLMMVHPSVPAKNVREMIALAKAKPGQLFYASSGHGTSPHLSMELFSLMAGIKMIQVPYKSSGPGVIDLLAGQVALMAPSMISGIPHVRSGKLRALGVTTAQRSPSAPDIPTIAEAGLPGYDSAQWYGLLAPAGTPRDVLDKLHKEVTSILLAPEYRDLLGGEGGIVIAGTPEAFASLIKTETAKWLRVAKEAGLAPE
jgi:tripartite-type tricarboxylate transporter receptor subunit TctC